MNSMNCVSPSAGGETATPFVGVQGFYISSESENQLAANEFLVNYIGTDEVQTALYEVGGRAPALLSAFEAAQSDADGEAMYNRLKGGEAVVSGIASAPAPPCSTTSGTAPSSGRGSTEQCVVVPPLPPSCRFCP